MITSLGGRFSRACHQALICGDILPSQHKHAGRVPLICMSVVVVERPNTLGLSTSTAIIVGTGVGPKNGIFVKDGCALKGRRELRRVSPKEKGTVTKGNLTMEC